MVLRLEYTLGLLGLVYFVVAGVLQPGPAQVGLFLAGAAFSAGAVVTRVLRRRRGGRLGPRP